MITIRLAQYDDREFWYTLDRHLPISEYDRKVESETAYVLMCDNEPVGLLRWNLFWDEIPFMNMLYIASGHRRKGFGKMLVDYFEKDVKARGFRRVLTSTQADEDAQHFYRKLGYRDAGGFVLEAGDPMEIMLTKLL